MTGIDWDRVETLARESWQEADTSVDREDFTTGFYAGYMYGAHDKPEVDELAEVLSQVMDDTNGNGLGPEDWVETAKRMKNLLLAKLPKQAYEPACASCPHPTPCPPGQCDPDSGCKGEGRGAGR